MDRRTMLASCAAAASAFALGCRGRGEAEAAATTKSSISPGSVGRPSSRAPRADLEVLDWTFPDDAKNKDAPSRRAVVLVPRPVPKGRTLPVLVALHGMGETTTPERGAHGWLDYYAIDEAIAALRSPPLTSDDYHGLVADDRLAAVNTELRRQPFGGMIVVCPYLPSGMGFALSFEDYAAWLRDVLLPRVRKETPASSDVRATGIDGVSLGGMTALEIGLSHPETFGVVGALQPAIRGIVGEVVDLAAQKLGARPLRLVTSTEDYFRDEVATANERLTAKGIAHDYLLTQGPHDYVWNKGPGAIEMLLWHDRKLRG
jgi:enterochelin esterase-like enzyme